MTTKMFMKHLIEIIDTYVDDLDKQDFYTDMIEAMSDNDVPVLEEYMGMSDSFDLVMEKLGRVPGIDEDELEYGYGC